MNGCPVWAPALGFAGATAALVLSSFGSAYGTGKAGIGISSIGVHHPDMVMKSIIPVVMAGVLGIYGLIIAVIIGSSVNPMSTAAGRTHSDFSAYTGFAQLGAGLCCGMSCLAAGLAIGIVGDAGVRAVAQQAKMYVGMVLILIFAEALGLYGLIVGLILAARTSSDCGTAEPVWATYNNATAGINNTVQSIPSLIPMLPDGSMLLDEGAADLEPRDQVLPD